MDILLIQSLGIQPRGFQVGWEVKTMAIIWLLSAAMGLSPGEYSLSPSAYLSSPELSGASSSPHLRAGAKIRRFSGE